MSVIELLLTALGLGLAGLDPTGVLVVIGALTLGARDRPLLVFGFVSILGTIAFGTSLSLALGPRLAGIDWRMLLPHDPTQDRVAAFVGVVLGLGLLVWGIVRIRRPAAHPPKPRAPLGIGAISLAGTGVVAVLAAILDPTFVSLVVIAGREESFWSVVAAQSTWAFVSHAPLVLVLAAAVGGNPDRVVAWVRSRWELLQPRIFHVVTAAVFLVAAYLLLDAGWWYATGSFLVPG